MNRKKRNKKLAGAIAKISADIYTNIKRGPISNIVVSPEFYRLLKKKYETSIIHKVIY